MQRAGFRRTLSSISREAILYAVPLLLYLTLRLVLLDGFFDRIDVEELEFGLFPAHLIQGLALPPTGYQTMWREGGSLLLGPFFAPVFACLGPSYYALKVSAVVFHALILLTWMVIARIGLGRPACLILGLLLAVPPPFMTRMNFVGWASHGEGNLFVGLMIVALLVTLRYAHRARAASLAAAAGVGLFAGLSLDFAYSTAPAVFLVGLVCLLNRRDAFRRRLPIVLAGLVVGLSPWMVYTVVELGLSEVVSQASGGVLGTLLQEPATSQIFDRTSIWVRIGRFVSQDMFWMWGFTEPDGTYRDARGVVAGLALWGLLAAWSAHEPRRWGTLLRNRGRLGAGQQACRAAMIVLPLPFVASYLVVCFATGLGISPEVFDGYRYLMPIYPWILLAAAAMLQQLWTRGPKGLRLVPAAIGVGLAVLFGLSQTEIRTGQSGSTFFHQLRGYHLNKIAYPLIEMPPDRRAEIRRTHPRDRWELAVMEGRAALHEVSANHAAADCSMEDALCSFHWEGMGMELAVEVVYGIRTSSDVGTFVSGFKTQRGQEATLDLARGMGRGLQLWGAEGRWPTIDAAHRDMLSPAEQRAYDLGVGMDEVLHRYYAFEGVFERSENVGMKRHLVYCEGLGMGVARMLLDPANAPTHPQIPSRLAKRALRNTDSRAAFVEGYRRERERLTSILDTLLSSDDGKPEG